MRCDFRQQRGSVVLVALCFVAVLAIATTTYLALCGRALTLSSRAFRADLSRQVAEMGLEEALRAYNDRDWTSWTVSSGNATRTISYASTKYGTSGITTTAKLKVFGNTAKEWNSTNGFAAGELAWYRGLWYRCSTTHAATNSPPPGNANWTSTPGIWSFAVPYAVNDIVVHEGAVYRCTVGHVNQEPPNASYWSTNTSNTWSSGTSYAVNDVAFFAGTPYRCIVANSNQAPQNTNYWISAPVIYSEGISMPPDGTNNSSSTQLRADISPAPLFPNALGATTSTVPAIRLATSGTIDSYNSNSLAGTYASQAVAGGANNYSAILSAPSVTISGAATIKGYITSPTLSFYYGYTYVVGPSSPAIPKVDARRLTTSQYVPSFDIQSVSGGSNLPAAQGNGTWLYEGSRSLGTAGATAPSIYNLTRTYVGGSTTSGLYLDESSDVLTINGPVILNVSGLLYTSGGGRIIISSTGSLELHFSGQMYIGDSGGTSGIINQTLDPTKLLIVSNSTYSSSNYHYLWTRQPFYGRIYMPDAYLHVWNSGFDRDIYGAISAKTIYFNHTAHVHYDTLLRTMTGTGIYNSSAGGTFIDSPYEIKLWRELAPSERLAL